MVSIEILTNYQVSPWFQINPGGSFRVVYEVWISCRLRFLEAYHVVGGNDGGEV